MKKKLEFRNIFLRFKGLFSIGFSDIISGGISSLFWLYLATLLDVESYGKIFYLLAIVSIASTVSLIGSRNTLSVYIPKNIQLHSAVFLIVIISGIVTTLIIFLMYGDLGSSLYVIGAVIFGLATSEILAKKLYVIYSKYLIIQKIISVVLPIGLYHWIGIDGIILGIALSFFIYIQIIIKTLKTTRVDFSLLQPRIGFLINSYAIDLSSTLSKQIDKLVIVPLLGLTLLANYQLGIQFISIFQLLPLTVLKYTLPHDAIGNSNKNLKIATILISICFTVIILIFTPMVIPLLFQKYIYVIEVIQVLSFSLVPLTIGTSYLSKFLANEQSKIVLIYSILNITSFVLSILIIGDTLHVVGMAVAYVISSIIPVVFIVIIDLKKKIK